MKDLTIRELIDLVEGEIPDSELRIEKMFQWHFERSILIIKWVLGASVSLFISVMIAFFKAEIKLPWWQITLVVLFAVGTATYGIYRLWQIRSMHRQFVSTLKIYSELKKITPFIIRYREK